MTMGTMQTKSIQCLLATLAALVVVGPSGDVFADDDEAVTDTGPIVRRKVLYRSTRVEITPAIGMTLNDAFRRNIITGLGLQYHLTNEFGIGVAGGYGILHPETDLAKNVTTTLQQSSPSTLGTISYSEVQWMVDFTLSYVPIFGKFTVFKSATIPYDLHLNGGLAIVNEVGQPAVAGGNVDSEVEGLRPGGVIGGGVRLFLSDMISLNLDMKTLFVSRAPVSSGSANAELKPTMYGSFGVGIFLPGAVKVSR